jgi:hypothetical protein
MIAPFMFSSRGLAMVELLARDSHGPRRCCGYSLFAWRTSLIERRKVLRS